MTTHGCGGAASSGRVPSPGVAHQEAAPDPQCDTGSRQEAGLATGRSSQRTPKPLGREMEGGTQFPSRMRKCPIFPLQLNVSSFCGHGPKLFFSENFHQDPLALIYGASGPYIHTRKQERAFRGAGTLRRQAGPRTPTLRVPAPSGTGAHRRAASALHALIRNPNQISILAVIWL